jgi:hypothetical protein
MAEPAAGLTAATSLRSFCPVSAKTRPGPPGTSVGFQVSCRRESTPPRIIFQGVKFRCTRSPQAVCRGSNDIEVIVTRLA